MSTINNVNNVNSSGATYFTSVTIDNGAATDSTIQLNYNAANEYIFGSKSSDSSFRISQSNALGTKDYWIMTSAGNLTKPSNCAAFYSSGTVSNVTGNGTVYTIGTSATLTKIKDFNSNMTTSGVLTAPVTGKYLISYNIQYTPPSGATGSVTTVHSLVTTANTFILKNFPTTNKVTSFAGNGGALDIQGSIVVSMTAADTALWKYTGTGGSAANDAIYSFGLSAVLIS